MTSRKAWNHFHPQDAFYTLSACCSSTYCHSIAGHSTCVFLLAFNLRIHVNQFAPSLYMRPPPPFNWNLILVTLCFLQDGSAWDATRESPHCFYARVNSLTLICIRDSPTQPTLTSIFFTTPNADMKVWVCTATCNDQGKSFAGLENGTECCECTSRRCLQGFLCFRHFVVLITHFGMPVCGNVVTDGATRILDSDCLSPCIGDNTQHCGGNDSLSLYWNGAKPQDPPTMPPYVDSWKLMGCFE